MNELEILKALETEVKCMGLDIKKAKKGDIELDHKLNDHILTIQSLKENLGIAYREIRGY